MKKGILYNAYAFLLKELKEKKIMKKRKALVLSIISVGMLALSGCGSSSKEATTEAQTEETTTKAEETTAEETVGMANPWTDSDKEGVLEATGFEMDAPEGATDVAYSYMQESGLAQMIYKLDDISWTYRIQLADKLTDISGMYYDWGNENGDKGEVSGREALYYGYLAPEDSDEDSAQLVNWYDVVTGTTYSLSAVAKDLNGIDMQAYAEGIYKELQGDATDDPEGDRINELNDYFLGERVSSYDGSTLSINDNNDGTFSIHISLFRLCDLEDGVGHFEDHKMYFDIKDPNEENMSGVIYRDSDNSLVVKITDSKWDLISNDQTFEHFEK